MLFRRIVAQIIDILLMLAAIVFSTAVLMPAMANVVPDDVAAIFALIISIALCVLVQYPFMLASQTVGKAFMGLEIHSTDEKRPDMTIGRFFQREILCKLMSCYFICLPMLASKPGGHDIASKTEVVKVKAPVRKKRKLAGEINE